MEHRWEARTAVDWEVVIRVGGVALIHARALNSSGHGIMVDTGHIALATGDVVELTCMDMKAARRRLVRALAQVVHFRSGRAGLIWVGRRNAPERDMVAARRMPDVPPYQGGETYAPNRAR